MNLGQRLYQFTFPPSFKLMPKDCRLLEQMYPKVDWSLVDARRPQKRWALLKMRPMSLIS